MNFFDADFDVVAYLQDDVSGTKLQKLQNAIRDMEAVLQKKIARGLTRAEYAQAQELVLAYQMAVTSLDKTYQSLHK
ncbi:MAG: hypothetical protein R3Y11_03330 [Pseudomonadota bacterium]